MRVAVGIRVFLEVKGNWMVMFAVSVRTLVRALIQLYLLVFHYLLSISRLRYSQIPFILMKQQRRGHEPHDRWHAQTR